jgi:hypothetical protein
MPRYVRGDGGFPEGAIHTIHPTGLVSPAIAIAAMKGCAAYRPE